MATKHEPLSLPEVAQVVPELKATLDQLTKLVVDLTERVAALEPKKKS